MAAADDIRAILATSSDLFTAGEVSSACILSNYDDEIETDGFGGSKQYIRRSDALVCADDFPNLGEDDAVTVNGAGYKVLSARLIQDGHVLMVGLQVQR
jgi:hypothetical protein